MTTPEPLYHLQNVRKTYATIDSGRYALNVGELVIPSQQVVVIIGESGSGKTTLLNILGMLDQPDDVTADGVKPPEILLRTLENGRERIRNLAGEHKDIGKLRRSLFGFVFQEDYLLKNISNLDNVRIPLLINGLDGTVESISSFFKSVDLDCAEYPQRLPDELSGGQAQRVAIIRSVIHNPQIIIADEPSSRLDHDHSRQVIEMLVSWCHGQQNRSLIWVTHDLELAAAFGDYVIILRDGEVVASRPNMHRQEETLLKWCRQPEGIRLPAIHDEGNAGIAGKKSAEFVKHALLGEKVAYAAARMPWILYLKAIVTFILADIFPPVKPLARLPGLIATPVNWLRSFLAVRRTQGLNILSLFMILMLALFFANVSFWLKNYFVYSVSDPRINNIMVTGKIRGDAVLSREDMQKLSTLSWVSGGDGEKISWQQEIDDKNLIIARPAISGAFGSRDRGKDFYNNEDNSRGMTWDNLTMLDLVVVNVNDPILGQIPLLEGKSLADLRSAETFIEALFRDDQGRIIPDRKGVVLSRESLEIDLGYEGVLPATVKMNNNAEIVEFPLLGVCEWLPFGARALVSEGWYEGTFAASGQGDPMPGYDRITLYIHDMLADGLPLAKSLSRMGYQTQGNIQSRLAWIKNLTDFISWSALAGVGGIGILVAGTLLVSFSQAIRRKQKELGLLLAQGIPHALLLVIFLGEMVLIWLVSAILAVLLNRLSAAILRDVMISKFELHMKAAEIFSMPVWAYWLIFGGSLLIASFAVVTAVHRTIGRPIAEILKTADN